MKRQQRSLLVIVLGLIGLLGCLSLMVAAPMTRPNDWCDVTGQIVWQGSIPKADPIRVTKDTECCGHDGRLASDTLVIDAKTRSVQWAVVWLDSNPDGGSPALPARPATKMKPDEVKLEINRCRFSRYVTAIQEGQPLSVVSKDTVSHHVTWAEKPGTIAPEEGRWEVRGLKAGEPPTQLQCTIHPWMSAYVLVFSHPYFAVTGADGTFAIPSVPRGTWRVKVWQPQHGYRGGKEGRGGESYLIREAKTQSLGDLILNK